MSERCPREIWNGFQSYGCGRPVKRDGLCGIHAAADDRVAKNRAARDDAKVEAQAIVDRLAVHDIPAYVSYDGTARLALSPEGLADLLDGRLS